MLRRFILIGLLLSSCATQRQAEKYFDKHPEQLADYVEQNDAFAMRNGKIHLARPKYYPPAIQQPPELRLGRLQMAPSLNLMQMPTESLTLACPGCEPMVSLQTVYITDSVELKKLQDKLGTAYQKHQALRRQLKTTQAQRDYWREMNRKKFWTLLAMAGFALLYILFRVLAARVKEEEV